MLIPNLDWESKSDRKEFDDILQKYSFDSFHSAKYAIEAQSFYEDLSLRGDAAIVEYLRKYSHSEYTEDTICVDPNKILEAKHKLNDKVIKAFSRAIENITKYQKHIMPTEITPVDIHGGKLGLRHNPVDSVGLAVPGGSGSYPSSVIMLAVPAQVAGVNSLCVATPPRMLTSRKSPLEVDSTVLGICGLLGIDRVYRIGGLALMALSLGTDKIEKVHMIAGPSNIYGQQAKRQIFGFSGIDGLYGPSEIVIFADDTANHDWIASDLIAQAEHNPGKAILFSTYEHVIQSVYESIKKMIPERKRYAEIKQVLKESCALVQIPKMEVGVDLINRIAPEHLTLALKDYNNVLKEIRHAGAIFLGDRSPVASGDYWAGPSHCLPTGGTAKFTSGCSVYTFLKRTSIEYYPSGLSAQAIEDIQLMANVEGFEGHANSIKLRK